MDRDVIMVDIVAVEEAMESFSGDCGEACVLSKLDRFDVSVAVSRKDCEPLASSS